MTAQTITRAFNSTNSLISAAKEHNNSFTYGIKKFFYSLFTLGLGKSIEDARAERREKEVVHVAFDILNELPKEYDDLNKSEFKSKILHTNFAKNYQIVQEGKYLCLYTGSVSQSPISGENHFDRKLSSKTILKEFLQIKDFQNLKDDLNLVKNSPYYQRNVDSVAEIRKTYNVTEDVLPDLVNKYGRQVVGHMLVAKTVHQLSENAKNSELTIKKFIRCEPSCGDIANSIRDLFTSDNKDIEVEKLNGCSANQLSDKIQQIEADGTLCVIGAKIIINSTNNNSHTYYTSFMSNKIYQSFIERRHFAIDDIRNRNEHLSDLNQLEQLNKKKYYDLFKSNPKNFNQDHISYDAELIVYKRYQENKSSEGNFLKEITTLDSECKQLMSIC